MYPAIFHARQNSVVPKVIFLIFKQEVEHYTPEPLIRPLVSLKVSHVIPILSLFLELFLIRICMCFLLIAGILAVKCTHY